MYNYNISCFYSDNINYKYFPTNFVISRYESSRKKKFQRYYKWR